MEKFKNDKFYLEKELLAPYTHLLKVRGKQLRVKITLAFNHWLRLPEDDLHHIMDTVNMLHASSLLMDDIQDNTKIRRGVPAAHCVYGLPLTLNTSIHVVFLVLTRVTGFGMKAVKIFTDEMKEIIRGQGIEIYWRDNFICPTEEEYKNMAKQKAGRMFALAVRLMQLFSSYKTDLVQLALLLGLYFQIRDDYCNLRLQEELEDWPEEDKEKPAQQDTSCCEDLTEGKYSLPIIHALNTTAKDQILSILRQRTQDVVLKNSCVALLDTVGSLQYTRDVLFKLDRTVRDEVARLGGNPDMVAVLDELLSWDDSK